EETFELVKSSQSKLFNILKQIKEKSKKVEKAVINPSVELVKEVEEIKVKIDSENQKILNREENCERVKLFNFEENLNLEELNDKKAEVLEVSKNLISENIKNLDKIEVIENFSGKVKVMRRDGLAEFRELNNEGLISTQFSDN